MAKVTAVLATAVLITGLSAKSATLRSQANVPMEIIFTAQRPHTDPFNEITLDVTFIDPSGALRKVPAFWAGGEKWKVRYASPLIGTHRWRSECSDASDAGLHAVEGTMEISAYNGENPLFRHGPIRVAANKRHSSIKTRNSRKKRSTNSPAPVTGAC